MAEVDTAQLASNQAAIRHDISAAEASIRDTIGRESSGINTHLGSTKYEVGNQAARLSQQIGAESCAINKHIGDMRQEDAENFGHTRRDVQAGFGDARYENEKGFSDTRREGADHTAEILRENVKSAWKNSDTTHREGQRIVDRLYEHDSTVHDRFFTVGRDTADLKAQVETGFVGVTKDTELAALKVQLDAAKNTTYLGDKLERDGEKTRNLIHDLKFHDLNRHLVERNTELVNSEQDRRYLSRHWEEARLAQQNSQFGAQFQQLQSMMQNFNSQLNDTKQGMVNFGTMAGVGQSSTNNNVR